MHLLAVDCRPFSLRARTSKPANGQCTQHSAPRKGTAQRESSAVSVSSRSPTPTQPPPRSKPVPCVRTYGFFLSLPTTTTTTKHIMLPVRTESLFADVFFSFLFFFLQISSAPSSRNDKRHESAVCAECNVISRRCVSPLLS